MVKNDKLLELFRTGDFEKLEEALKDNIREESATSKGNRTELQAIKNVLKYCKKNNPQFDGFVLYGEKFAYIDGYRILVVDNDFGYEPAASQIDIKKMECTIFSHEIEVDITAVKTLKKTDKKAFYSVEVDGVKTYLNCDYLLDCYAISKSNKFFFNQTKSVRYNCNKAPLYQLAEDGTIKTLLLPVMFSHK